MDKTYVLLLTISSSLLCISWGLSVLLKRQNRRDKRLYTEELLTMKKRLSDCCQEKEVLQQENAWLRKSLLDSNANNEDTEQRTVTDLANLLRRIKHTPSLTKSDEYWMLLELFEDTYCHSFTSYLSKFPNLTSAERKTCLLVRLGMDNDAIAAILCVTPESVSKYKTRAKEKLYPSDPKRSSLYDLLRSLPVAG